MYWVIFYVPTQCNFFCKRKLFNQAKSKQGPLVVRTAQTALATEIYEKIRVLCFGSYAADQAKPLN